MSRQLDMKSFMGHKTRETGSGGKILRSWRKRTPPRVDTVMHCDTPIVALWQHQLQRIIEKKNEDGDVERKIVGYSFNCAEDEEVLRRQYHRDRDTGKRVAPPVLCPVCRLTEELRRAYRDGDVGFTDPVFKWVVDDEKVVLSVGGMLGMYGKDNLTTDEKDAMKRSKIRPSEAWKENVNAKCNYVFTVVDYDDPASGVQIAIEGTSLGDHVRECIANQCTALGDDDGMPWLKPYVIRWQYSPTETEFNKKYKAVAMPRLALGDDILELIHGEAPNLDNLTRVGNAAKLRAELEAHCVLADPDVIDWDLVFGPAEAVSLGEDPEREATKEEKSKRAAPAKSKAAQEEDEEDEAPPPPPKKKAKQPPPEPKEEDEEDEAPPPPPKKKAKQPEPPPPPKKKAKQPEPEPEEEDEEDEEDEAPPPPPKKKAAEQDEPPATRRALKKKPEPEPEPEPAEDSVQCEACGAPMGPKDTTCAECGAEYELDEEEAPPPPPKKPVKYKPSF